MVLAGGQSAEHTVSLSSARSLLAAVDSSRFSLTVQVIDRAGYWRNTVDSLALLYSDDDSVSFIDDSPTLNSPSVSRIDATALADADVVFPLLHGPYGEDGTVQGLLEMVGVPYVGCGVLASALCMDKVLCKTVLATVGIAQVPYLLITKQQFMQGQNTVFSQCKSLPSPWFVKPANLGSAVGINKAIDQTTLISAIDTAFKYDRRVIVESGVSHARELEIGVLGNDSPRLSAIGEISFGSDFYDYDTKYTDGLAQLHIPADIPEHCAAQIREWALKAYAVLDCQGFARIDFFYNEDNDLLVLNEINTIPGFTPTSMFPKLWAEAGVPYSQLFENLIDLALEKQV